MKGKDKMVFFRGGWFRMSLVVMASFVVLYAVVEEMVSQAILRHEARKATGENSMLVIHTILSTSGLRFPLPLRHLSFLCSVASWPSSDGVGGGIVANPEHELKEEVTVPSSSSSSSKLLPRWVRGFPVDFQREMMIGSDTLTDKVDNAHRFHHVYQPHLSSLVKRKLYQYQLAVHEHGQAPKPTIRFLEIGLGCAPGGGMLRHTPGGSARGWRHLFDQLQDFDVEFDFHVMEFDAKCANAWAAKHPTVAKVHTGDASSEEDLKRVMAESGGLPFDVMIDDGSHINWHQIKTAEVLLPFIGENGIYVIEDIMSSCLDWSANMGTHNGAKVGGNADCMTTTQDSNTGAPGPTILAQLMEWQRHLVGETQYKSPIGPAPAMKGVTGIDIFPRAALISKEVIATIPVGQYFTVQPAAYDIVL